MMSPPAVVIDTNVLVASGFNSRSHSAQIVEQVRCGQLRMVWAEQTREEAAFIVGKIPPLSWQAIAVLFRPEDCYEGALLAEQFQHIPDKADIKFAALSDATGAPLITMDRALLSIRETLRIAMWTPFEFLELGNCPLEGG